MNNKETFVIEPENIDELPISADIKYNSNYKNLVIFCHGYKGFKDWGCWNIVSDLFYSKELNFLKFNFSHNGLTLIEQTQFTDLKTFSKNNYSIEVNDLSRVINYISSNKLNINYENIYIIGHSRGSGIACLSTQYHSNITKVVSWAGVASFKERFPSDKELKEWRKNGTRYIFNSRTEQKMPHLYEFYTDFINNEEKLTIKTALLNFKGDFLSCYGLLDQVIPNKNAFDMAKWATKSSTFGIRTNHTFGSKHPWNEKQLPIHLKEICLKTIDFLKSD